MVCCRYHPFFWNDLIFMSAIPLSSSSWSLPFFPLAFLWFRILKLWQVVFLNVFFYVGWIKRVKPLICNTQNVWVHVWARSTTGVNSVQAESLSPPKGSHTATAFTLAISASIYCCTQERGVLYTVSTSTYMLRNSLSTGLTSHDLSL